MSSLKLETLIFKPATIRAFIPNQRFILVRTNFNRTVVTSTVDWRPLKSQKTPNEDESKPSSSIGKKIVLGLMIAMPVISFYLGTWQYRRLDWKKRLIASCEDRLTYKVTPLPKHFQFDDCENWEYRRVSLKGHYVYQEEMFVGPRVRNGLKGYVLFTPFVREDTGEKMIIERGWISEEKVYPGSRTLHHLSAPSGSTEIVCFVRVPRERSTFQWEKTDASSRVWEIANIFEMAKLTNSVPVHLQAIYDMTDRVPINNMKQSSSPSKSSWKFWQKSNDKPVEDANNKTQEVIEFNENQFIKAGVPIGKTPKIDFRNNHLQYIMTWYGLSLLSTIFLIIALAKMRKGSAVSQAQIKKDKLKHAKKYM